MLANDTRIRVKRRAAAWLAWASMRAGRWLDSAPYGPRSRAGDGAAPTRHSRVDQRVVSPPDLLGSYTYGTTSSRWTVSGENAGTQTET